MYFLEIFTICPGKAFYIVHLTCVFGTCAGVESVRVAFENEISVTFFDVVFTEKTQKCYYLTGKKSGTAKVTVKSNGKTMEVMTVKVVKEE